MQSSMPTASLLGSLMLHATGSADLSAESQASLPLVLSVAAQSP